MVRQTNDMVGLAGHAAQRLKIDGVEMQRCLHRGQQLLDHIWVDGDVKPGISNTS